MEPEQKAKMRALIEDAEDKAKKARTEIDRAKRAGIDMSEQDKQLIEIEAKNRQMRAVYIEGK